METAGPKRKPIIVWLPHVYPHECAEPDINDLLPVSLRTVPGVRAATRPAARTHSVIPARFTEAETYLRDPTVPCWYCNDTVQGFAWFMPTRITLSNAMEIVEMTPRGCYCGFVCTAAAIRRAPVPPEVRNERLRMLYRLVEIVCRLKPNSLAHIFDAPDVREKIADWGQGAMSRLEYRRLLLSMRDKTLNGARRANCMAPPPL
jgi:hypothetical protein